MSGGRRQKKETTLHGCGITIKGYKDKLTNTFVIQHSMQHFHLTFNAIFINKI